MRNLSKCLIISLATATLLYSSAFAAGGAHGEGIPGEVKFQALNIIVFLAILIYFAGPKVKALFIQRNEDFHRMARETEKARKDLENKKADLVRRARELRENYDQSIAQAQKEAEMALQEQVAKAKEEASRILRDAEAQLKAESSKLVEKLRQETLEMSLANADSKLQALSQVEKGKINSGFVQRVEGATL